MNPINHQFLFVLAPLALGCFFAGVFTERRRAKNERHAAQVPTLREREP